ncbi:sarcosine oxidase subunit gamma [Neorhizobium galegae]|uniref:sarcosine oxidase subunit gamma n=1 Tax=Neorhizobium galegae TaxID=399 RepID=UPI0006216E04|nr:sarcosine oxidase subunit gamma family protein [Neorhizobium galegae]MCQ1851119.1 sarcosine oxidase subunit gamma [Neorhizobium galegae]CDZ50716.1 Sarcosine oxidase gamma subunit [Neorhizobium galegae bv. orientalis]
MSINLLHRHVLEDHISGFETDPNPNHLLVIRRPVIFTVLAHAGQETTVAEALWNAPDVAPRFCGPSEWLAVSRTVGAETVAGMLSDIAGASVVDQSDGQVLMEISGPSVRKILGRCVAVDLHPEVFEEGRSATMLCCHVAANVARTGADTFEIVVPRSFAGSVFGELTDMGREHALTCGFAD